MALILSVLIYNLVKTEVFKRRTETYSLNMHNVGQEVMLCRTSGHITSLSSVVLCDCSFLCGQCQCCFIVPLSICHSGAAPGTQHDDHHWNYTNIIV